MLHFISNELLTFVLTLVDNNYIINYQLINIYYFMF